MMTRSQISQYRKCLRQLIQKFDKLAFYCAYPDHLVRGTPGVVYRKCGNVNCQCAKGGEHRHGPYLVIQVRRDGQARQIALKKSERALWDKAKHYQKQMEKISELNKCFLEIKDLVQTIVKKREMTWP